MFTNSIQYRDWLRKGIRLFDTQPSKVLAPGERISYMRMDDLEAAFELIVGDWRPVAPAYRVVSNT